MTSRIFMPIILSTPNCPSESSSYATVPGSIPSV